MVSARVKAEVAEAVIEKLGRELQVSLVPRTVFDVVVNERVAVTLSRAEIDGAIARGDGFAELVKRDAKYREVFGEVAVELAADALNYASDDGEYEWEEAEAIVRMRDVAAVLRQLHTLVIERVAPVVQRFDDPHS